VKSLKTQLAALAHCDPAKRIDLREPILAHGADAVAPLSDLVVEDPELGPSVTAWFEVLANRDEEARPSVVAALKVLVASTHDDTRRHATEALGRMGVRVPAPRARRTAAARS
jgi:hypothetical protein